MLPRILVIYKGEAPQGSALSFCTISLHLYFFSSVLLSLWHVHISIWDHFSELPLIFISVQAYWCQGL